jgi:hypothetical protein
VLARLDEIPGVSESRVDWTGRRFLLQLEPSAREERVAEAAEDTLGEGAYTLDESGTRAALEAMRKGEAWMRAGETLRLSRHEAGVLAQRHGEEAALEIDLDQVATRKLVELFERELNVAFERTHAGRDGGGARIEAEVASAAQRVIEASRAFLDARQRAALEEYLGRFIAPRGG